MTITLSSKRCGPLPLLPVAISLCRCFHIGFNYSLNLVSARGHSQALQMVVSSHGMRVLVASVLPRNI